MPKVIIITYSRAYEEYRVPGLNPKREVEAYYTSDKDDALATAGMIHGPHVILKIRTLRNEE